jgi:hypothetical protein
VRESMGNGSMLYGMSLHVNIGHDELKIITECATIPDKHNDLNNLALSLAISWSWLLYVMMHGD